MSIWLPKIDLKNMNSNIQRPIFSSSAIIKGWVFADQSIQYAQNASECQIRWPACSQIVVQWPGSAESKIYAFFCRRLLKIKNSTILKDRKRLHSRRIALSVSKNGSWILTEKKIYKFKRFEFRRRASQNRNPQVAFPLNPTKKMMRSWIASYE